MRSVSSERRARGLIPRPPVRLRRIVHIGAILLIALGILHAMHVGTSDDVEPYLWGASAFLVVQGIITIGLIRGARRDERTGTEAHEVQK